MVRLIPMESLRKWMHTRNSRTLDLLCAGCLRVLPSYVYSSALFAWIIRVCFRFCLILVRLPEVTGLLNSLWVMSAKLGDWRVLRTIQEFKEIEVMNSVTHTNTVAQVRDIFGWTRDSCPHARYWVRQISRWLRPLLGPGMLSNRSTNVLKSTKPRDLVAMNWTVISSLQLPNNSTTTMTITTTKLRGMDYPISMANLLRSSCSSFRTVGGKNLSHRLRCIVSSWLTRLCLTFRLSCSGSWRYRSYACKGGRCGRRTRNYCEAQSPVQNPPSNTSTCGMA